MELFHEPLIESSFIPVSEHQSQTPVSFYSGPPVLHFKSSQNRLLCLKEEASRHPAIETFIKDGNTHEDSWLIEEIDVWVSSEYVLRLRCVSLTKNMIENLLYGALPSRWVWQSHIL